MMLVHENYPFATCFLALFFFFFYYWTFKKGVCNNSPGNFSLQKRLMEETRQTVLSRQRYLNGVQMVSLNRGKFTATFSLSFPPISHLTDLKICGILPNSFSTSLSFRYLKISYAFSVSGLVSFETQYTIWTSHMNTI